jgi:tRNA A-37 threonylcarbamoyl transferase component Bud32
MNDACDTIPVARLAEIAEDLQKRWESGERPAVEVYLEQHRWLKEDQEAVLELVCLEMILRQESGETLILDEFVRRFPGHGDALRRLFQIHRALDAGPPSLSAQPVCDVPGQDKKRAESVATLRISDTAADGNSRPRAAREPPGASPLPAPQGYEIGEEIGRGGMGVVYKARQAGLNRTVALKVILSGPYANEAALARFRGEAEAVARLQHPAIVQVFELGQFEGRPFLAMEYVGCGSLAQRVGGTPQTPREAAQLVEHLARAIHVVHQQGIVHRDLKPANILLSHAPTTPLGQSAPKIVDFGLAKFLDAEGPAATASLDVLGTPLYMAPEQAAGRAKEVGPAVDVYALGAVLYLLLTGEPPFKGETVFDTLQQIRSRDPVPPGRLLMGLSRDLETICLKCLEKEPRKRYASAELLADDLRRFLTGQPVLARPTPWWERCHKWARREPRVAALIALVCLVTLVGLVTTATLWRVAERRARAEARERQNVQQQLSFNRIALADRELRAGRVAWAREQLELCPQGLRDWEWHHLMGRCEGDEASKVCAGHSGAVSSVAFSHDGRRLASGSGDHTVRIWDPMTASVTRELQGHVGAVNWLSFSPAGDRLASAGEDAKVILWNVPTGEQDSVFRGHDSPVGCVAFRPQSQELASGTFNSSGPGEILVWAAKSGQVRLTLKGHTRRVTSLAYSSDGKRLYSSSHDETVRVWDSATGETVRIFNGHSFPVAGLAVCPNGSLVASAAGRSVADQPDEGEILVWEAASGRIVHHLRGHRERPMAMAFSPDGRRLATAGWDQEIKLWDVASGQELLALAGHRDGVMSLAFSGGGELLASAGMDRSVRIWQGPPLRER